MFIRESYRLTLITMREIECKNLVALLLNNNRFITPDVPYRVFFFLYQTTNKCVI